MDTTRLRVQANQDADSAPNPDPHERPPWAAERAAAVMLLAEIADRDSQLLRNASGQARSGSPFASSDRRRVAGDAFETDRRGALRNHAGGSHPSAEGDAPRERLAP